MISLNFSNKKRVVFGSILICVFGAGLRLFPDFAHPMKEAEYESKAAMNIRLKDNIRTKITQARPDLEPIVVEKLVQDHFTNKTDLSNPDLINIRKKIQSRLFEEKRKNLPLLGADPYYYLGLTREVLMNGIFWNETRGKLYLNKKMMAPEGHYYPIDFHPFVGAAVHGIAVLFNRSVEPEQTVRWVPVILYCLTVTAFVWCSVYVFRFPFIFIMMGASYLAFAPIYLKRSLIGWYDTDPYNVLFPILIISSVYLSLLNSRKSTVQWKPLIITGLTMTLYSLFWRGWIMVCFFVLMAAFATLIFEIFYERKIQRNSLIGILMITVIPAVLTLVFWGFEGLKLELTSLHEYTGVLSKKTTPLWPDVFMMVGELKTPGLPKAIRLIGGYMFAFVTFAGLITGIADSAVKKRRPDSYLIFILVLCSGVLLLSASVERIGLIAVAPFSIGFTAGMTHLPKLLQFILNRLLSENGLRNSGKIIASVTALMFALVVIEGSAHARKQIEKFRPIYNTSWDRMMKYIRTETEDNSIIATWWSPGHFITSNAHRRVLIDGATQNQPRAYWVAKFFIESSEPVSVSILRMLTASGDRFQNLLLERLPLPEAMRLMERILPLPRSVALNVLSERFGHDTAQEMVNTSFPQSPPETSYVLLYRHMMDQAAALEFTGNWSFDKAQALRTLIEKFPEKIPQKALKKGSKSYTELLWSLTESPSPKPEEGSKLKFGADFSSYTNGISIADKPDSIRLRSKTLGSVLPSFILYNSDGELRMIRVKGATSKVSVIFYGNESLTPETLFKASHSVVVGPGIAESVAARLFWLDGAGLRFFKHVHTESDVTKNSRFVLYKIDWNEYYRYMNAIENKLAEKKTS